MRKIITLCAALVLSIQAFAQTPEKISYQAVVRNGSNNLVTSAPVGMKLSVLKGSATGAAVYVETQTPSTNTNGLVTLEIGAGNIVTGAFNTIDWADGPYFIKTETDAAGGSNYSITGTSQLLSVPYALHAKTAETVTGAISANDPRVPDGTQTGDLLFWNGTTWAALSPGANGTVLTMVNGLPAWAAADGSVAIPTVTNPTTGRVWMDRNLGASQVATSPTDQASFGDYYQWGRGTDGHEKVDSKVTFNSSATDTPGHGLFIATVQEPFDWRTPGEPTLWQGAAGVNNPCPSGFRLPTTQEWEEERLTWSSTTSTAAFDSPLKLPLAGSRNFQDGANYMMTEAGFYWTSSVNGLFSILMYLHPMIAFQTNNYRAQGFSVRCIKD